MSTALDIIRRAYQMIGWLASNEPLSGADTELGADQLNKMLDSWSNESLMCYAVLEQSTVLVPGKTAYTIGSGGDIDAARPLKLRDGYGAAYLRDSNNNNYWVTVVQKDRWNLISNRGPTITSNIPDTLFYDPQFPLGVINIWPTPTEAMTLFWDSYLALPDMPTTATAFSLPPGYELALQSNLAVLLAPFCGKTQVSPDVRAIAMQSKAQIKRTNIRLNVAQFDPEISENGRRSYNIYTDGPR